MYSWHKNWYGVIWPFGCCVTLLASKLWTNYLSFTTLCLLFYALNHVLDASDSNSQESGQSIAKVTQPFQDTNVVNSAVPDYNVRQTKSQTFGDKGKPQRKRRKLLISEIQPETIYPLSRGKTSSLPKVLLWIHRLGTNSSTSSWTDVTKQARCEYIAVKKQ